MSLHFKAGRQENSLSSMENCRIITIITLPTELQGKAGGMRIHGEGNRRLEGSFIQVLYVAALCFISFANESNGGDNHDQSHVFWLSFFFY